MEGRIEQVITIRADLDRVWELVTRPGWWVPDSGDAQPGTRHGTEPGPEPGTEPGTEPDRTPGSVTVRESAQWGRFLVEVVRMEPKKYAAFRWASEFPGQAPAEGNSTLVEFFVRPAAAEGEVSVTLVESGFGQLPEDHRETALKDNTGGWEQELASLKERAERG